MNPDRAFLLRFTGLLVASLGLALVAHAGVRAQTGLDPWGDRLLASYGINAALAAAIVWALFLFRRRIRTQIGFLFIAGSLLKFAAFFVFLYPSYQLDDDLSRAEFGAFFIPYMLALVLEVVFTAKILRDLENEDTR